MEARQSLFIPPSRTPAQIIAFRVAEGEQVSKDSPICIYEYTATVQNTDPETGKTSYVQERTRDELRSVYEGKVESFLVNRGDVVKKGEAVAVVIEPCGHAVQLNGLCALCGKDLSIADYTGSETERATIRMTHDALGVTVSQAEAARIERENTERLLRDEKLSLILDLDQTIIHATVDPTVGEWMNDPQNPNFPALKDVYKFTLPDSPVVYYIKLRPGTRQFLQEMSKLFEMHIYTMGTRNYAQAVASIIDPNKDLFKERILSRDESGSFAVKSIQRLFPCDQSMVLVVDDRADIWQWPPNLIKVNPYDFFVGIGDINEPIYAASQATAEKHHKLAPGIVPMTTESRPSTTPDNATQANTPPTTTRSPSTPSTTITPAPPPNAAAPRGAPDALLRDPARIGRLLDAIERGKVLPGDLDASQSQRLLAHADAAIKERAGKLLSRPGDRRRAIEAYAPAVAAAGDAPARERFREGVGFIRKSVEVNPEAHFGREQWQAAIAEFLLAAMDEPALLKAYDCLGNRLDLDTHAILDRENNWTETAYGRPYDMAFSKGEVPPSSASIRDHIMKVGAEAGWEAVAVPSHRVPAAFDEPTLGMIGMWRQGGGANPHFALALGETMLRVGQRSIAWTAYERAYRLADRYSADPAIQEFLREHCRKRQAQIGESLASEPARVASLLPQFEAELAYGE
ncbi:Carboxy-terminal domain (CTD) phosphatase, partial [Quaeritorhiza haematococci]